MESLTLSSDHIVQLSHLAALTELPWEEVLNQALSEYRGLIDAPPPVGELAALDAPANSSVAFVTPGSTDISQVQVSA